MAFDHIGGLHSVFSALSRGMTIVAPAALDGQSVNAALRAHQVFLLPTTPAHLALLLQSGCFDEPLPHLKLISYGAEAMSPALKQRISDLQPQIRWRETYGSTETGILSLQSGSDPGCWQPSFPYKVIESELHVQNLTGDWVPTGDFVEELGGGRLRFLGRKSTRVKVGGVLVSPERTAAWLRKQPGVWQAAVDAVPNLLLGHVLEARVWAAPEFNLSELEKQLRSCFPIYFTREAMPVRYRFEEVKLSDRMKLAAFFKTLF
jgi:acyl-coenzyme A synthetase/AMP-(fatty) acid ligase